MSSQFQQFQVHLQQPPQLLQVQSSGTVLGANTIQLHSGQVIQQTNGQQIQFQPGKSKPCFRFHPTGTTTMVLSPGPSGQLQPANQQQIQAFIQQCFQQQHGQTHLVINAAPSQQQQQQPQQIQQQVHR